MTASDEMTAFVSVVDEGSFAGAARALSLTPSAVSKTVGRLEQRLGTRLLTRTTRRLSLTAEGETFLLRCREILASIEAAEAEAARSSDVPRGHIRVSAGAAVGRSLIVRMLPAFQAEFPEISIDLRISEDPVDLVTENIDLAVRVGEMPDSSLVARRLCATRRLICASPAYLERYGMPERPDDLRKHNCILISNIRHLARWPFHDGDGIAHVQVSGNVITDSADVMLDLALAGHGIVRMLDIRLGEAIRNGQLIPLLADIDASEAVPVWAVMPPGRNRLPRLRVFLDFLIERFGELARSAS